MRQNHKSARPSRADVARVGAALVASLVFACTPSYEKPIDPPTDPDPGQPCTRPVIDHDRSLVVHDLALLGPKFPLQRTLQKIIDTSGSAGTTPQALLATMLASFDEQSFVQPVSGKTIPVKQRPQEAALPPAQLLDPSSPQGMVPTGLFNRLDLAPADGSNCGEYRIAYAKKQDSPGRFLVIFEAKLPNPDPGAGLAGCQPVAKFWADLSAESDPARRIDALEEFYYDGLPGGSFGPVVTHANYGLPLGQVRTNLFIEPLWELREHRTDLDPVEGAVFRPDTVKENPLVEWFRAPGSLPSGITTADQEAFRSHFLDVPTCNLLRPDRVDPAANAFEIVNGIGGGFDPAGDDFRSVSQGDEDNPAVGADPVLNTAITARLGALGVSAVDSNQLLNRAGAMTCGGCHQFSNGVALGSGATWPNSAFFVHIREDATLSPALTSFFLPRRAEILARFVCDPTAEAQDAAPCPGTGTAPSAALRARARPAVAAVPAVPATGLDPGVLAQMRRGRGTAPLQRVDEARVAVLAASRRVRAASPAAMVEARSTAEKAETALETAVESARLEEEALPGAFVPVRRTH